MKKKQLTSRYSREINFNFPVCFGGSTCRLQSTEEKKLSVHKTEIINVTESYRSIKLLGKRAATSKLKPFPEESRKVVIIVRALAAVLLSANFQLSLPFLLPHIHFSSSLKLWGRRRPNFEHHDDDRDIIWKIRNCPRLSADRFWYINCEIFISLSCYSVDTTGSRQRAELREREEEKIKL